MNDNLVFAESDLDPEIPLYEDEEFGKSGKPYDASNVVECIQSTMALP